MKPRVGGGIVYFLVVLMTLLLRISQRVGVDDALGVDMSLLFTLVVQLCCFGLLPVLGWWIIVGRCQKDEIRALPRVFYISKCHMRDFARTLLITVPLLLLVGVAAGAWQNFLYLTGFETGGSSASEQTAAALIAEIALSAVLPGIFEELTHRGLLVTAFRDGGGKVVFVSALLFALMHQNVMQFAHTFVLGAVLACIVYCTGSVLPAMFVHFFNNFISIVQSYDELVPAFGIIGTVRSWLYGSVAGVAVLILLAALSVVAVAFVLRAMRFDAVREGRLPDAPFFRSEAGAIALSRDILLIGTVAVGAAATLFSLVWGYL